MKHWFPVIFIFLCSSSAIHSQSIITITGKLVDIESGEPIVFASIGIEGAPVGTVSNSLGEFDFHFPDTYKNDHLIVRMLGYKNLKVKPADYVKQGTVIFKMTKVSKVLDEVIVEDSLSGNDILAAAIANIDKNYPDTSFMMDGFYRDLKKIGGKYFSMLEAAVKIYDDNYAEPANKNRLREQVALVEVRKSMGYDNKFMRYFEKYNLLENLLLSNNVRYRKFSKEEYFPDHFEREKNTVYNGRQVYISQGTFTASDNISSVKIKLFVDVESYAILRIEYKRIYDPKILKKKGNVVSKYIYDEKSIDFKEYAGRMFLNYMTSTSKINWYDEETDELRFETQLEQELMINNIQIAPKERISRTEKMHKYGLQYQDKLYNKKFWDNYNVIKDTPLDRQVADEISSFGIMRNHLDD